MSLQSCARPGCKGVFKSSGGHSVHLRRSPKCATWFRKHFVTSRPSVTESSSSESDSGSESGSNDEWTTSSFSSLDLSISSDPETPIKPRFSQPRQPFLAEPPLPEVGDVAVDTSATAPPLEEHPNPPNPESTTSEDDILLPEPDIRKHPTAADDFGKGNTILDQIDIDDPAAAKQRAFNPYYPFFDKDDWEISSWLTTSGLSMAEIDKFLRFDFVSMYRSSQYVSLFFNIRLNDPRGYPPRLRRTFIYALPSSLSLLHGKRQSCPWMVARPKSRLNFNTGMGWKRSSSFLVIQSSEATRT